jgi:ribosomal small subunit protein bTHX
LKKNNIFVLVFSVTENAIKIKSTLMGRGDKKTAKGKRTMGSYGNSRKRKVTTTAAPVAKVKTEKAADTEKKPAAKKPAAKKATTKTKETSAE